MKLVVVLGFDVPDMDTAPADILKAIDPPHLPYFVGEARLTVDPWATTVERYLDQDDS